MASTPVFSSFNAGELSPKMDARSDVEKYNQGCRSLENFINLPQGGVQRRSGFKYIAKAKNPTNVIRLLPFNFSNDSSVVIEAGEKYMRFYMDGEPVLDGGSPYEIATPWVVTDLDELRFRQSADVMYFAHPRYFPYKLSRYSTLDWRLELIDFTYQAFKDENVDDENVLSFEFDLFDDNNVEYKVLDICKDPTDSEYYECILGYTTTSGDPEPNADTTHWKLAEPSYGGSKPVTVTASKPTFFNGMEGAYWLVRHPRVDNEISETYPYTPLPTYSSDIPVKGDWTFVTHGTWTGEVVIERSFDGGTTWHNYRNYSSQGDRNIDATGTEEMDGVLYRTGRVDGINNSGTVKCYFNVRDYFVDGILQIETIVSDTVAIMNIIEPLGDLIPTGTWAEGAWSDYSGYPTCLAFFEERLCWGGTKAQPQTIWMSKSADYENLTTGELDDDALIYTISSGEVDAIKWMYPQNDLLIGTAGNEWKFGATKINEALTPTNVSCKIQSNNGSSDIEPLFIDNAILYAQNHSKIIREMAYSYDNERYMSADLTITSDHILGRLGIKCMSYQRNPFSIAWFVRKDGTITGLTYNREQKVIAWHRHNTNGDIISLTVINGEYEDEVWVAVNRNGQVVVERMEQFNFYDIEDCRFIDSFLDEANLDLTVPDRIGGLGHLGGETVSVFCDGAYKGDYPVLNDEYIEFNHTPYTKIAVGLNYTSVIETMRIEGQIADGGSQGRIKRIDQVVVRFLDTIGGKVINTEGQENLIPFRYTTDQMNNQIPLFFGDKKVKFGGGYNEAMTVKVIQDIPMPMTILMLSPRISVNG